MAESAQGGDCEEVYLDDTWTLWFHDPNDSDWTNSSYSQVATVSSANNFWAVQSLLGDKIRCGMFFLMREHVFPCWDDKNNAKGGCLSMKVSNEMVPSFWESLCSSLLSESLLLAGEEGAGALDAHQHVNGVSITPKNTFCVFKIWIGEFAPQDPDRYDVPPFMMGQVLFRSHASCIADAATKTLKAV